MSKIVTKHTVYAAWDYKKEVEDLNKLSAEGLQLIKGGCLYSQYEEDKSVQYRYQLDYNRKIDNRMRYIESFREQGWEYINSTFNGWHYFRKPYDPSLPDSEYEIYTDMPSLGEMAKRWLKLGYTIEILISLLFLLTIYQMIRQPEIYRAGLLLEYVVFEIMLLSGISAMKRMIKGNYTGAEKRFPLGIVFGLFMISLLWILIWGFAKDSCEGTWIGNTLKKDDYPVVNFEMKLPEFVYLSLENDPEFPCTVLITNQKGREVYRKSGDALELEDERIFLPRGSYQLTVSYDTGNDIGNSIGDNAGDNAGGSGNSDAEMQTEEIHFQTRLAID